MASSGTPGNSIATPGPGDAASSPKGRGIIAFLTAPRRRPSFGPAEATALAIVVGIAFRIAEYLGNRPLWMDEGALLSNLAGVPVFEFGVPLRHDQMAPPGFLVIARVWVRVLGDSSFAIRLLPLACGIASLFAMAAVARRSVSEAAVPIALALFAVSDDLIYYATEFKQYAADLLIALGCLRLGSDLLAGEWTRRRVAVAGVLGVGATWLSHPAIFVLGAAGMVLVLDAVARRDRRRFAAAMGVGAAWAAGFAGCFAVSDAMMTTGAREFLWAWWGFAFLPLPPGSASEAGQVFWQFANVFDNPAGVVTPMDPRSTAMLAVALFLAGVGALAARGWRGTLLILLPIALTMVASALGRYPFHGRVIVFLAPFVLLPVAEGVALVGRRCGRAVLFALVGFLLVAPTTVALDHILAKSRHRVFDSHGDQRNDLLDYLERRSPSVPPRHRSP